uniref:prephenate dehydrogenase/arogenate dehydrogenase family protein n=1 Tax=Acetatifactor sp. TaxID=1872090 RepID=UPI0040564C5B
MSFTTFGFIGLGLIGGSIARAIKEKVSDSVIIAYDINPDTLYAAKNENVADIVTTSIDESFRACNYIFLCAPVQKNDENLFAVKNVLSPSCLLTDVGSVKSDIHRTIADAELNDQFIGGHPMAGSERVGFINSKAVLLENAYYILTPTDTVPQEKVSAYKELVQTLGALPLILSPSQHDYVTAAVSHLPHVIAASLVNLVKDSDSADGIMKMIAAGGFKDITRIASSSAAMWQQICLTNTENITALLSDYIDSLAKIKESLENRSQEALYDLFDTAREYRDSFSNASSGPIKRSYSIRIDIADEPGALATIVAILAANGISIKNIGISHNREFEGGILRIEFHEEASILKAAEILRNRNYVVN